MRTVPAPMSCRRSSVGLALAKADIADPNDCVPRVKVKVRRDARFRSAVVGSGPGCLGPKYATAGRAGGNLMVRVHTRAAAASGYPANGRCDQAAERGFLMSKRGHRLGVWKFWKIVFSILMPARSPNAASHIL